MTRNGSPTHAPAPSIHAMRRIARWAGLLLSCCLVLASGPAIGQTLRFDDPAGDGQKGTHLDITSIKVANRDHVLVTTISFVKVAAGDLAVGFKQRGRGPRGEAVVTSLHRTRGDKNALYTVAGAVRCKGFRVTWDATLSRVRVRIPSRCITDGDYGAIKVQALAEIGSDADFAPKTPKGNWGWTDWVSRG
jgi:hypothetical protein